MKHICKLSTIMKIMLSLILCGVLGLMIEADSIPLFRLVFHAEVLVLIVLASYLLIERFGVSKGYILDDIGFPPPRS